MKVTVKYDPPENVLIIRAENKEEGAILVRFLRPGATTITLARNRQYKDYPDLEIRKEPTICRNTQKP